MRELTCKDLDAVAGGAVRAIILPIAAYVHASDKAHLPGTMIPGPMPAPDPTPVPVAKA